MEEKKAKRWRPTLTAYREQEEVIHRQCVELDAWREQYRDLDRQMKDVTDGRTVSLSKYGDACDENARLKAVNAALMTEVSTLQQSNKAMEDELRRRSNCYEAEMRLWREKAIENETEVMRLTSRGFLSRLFNL